MLLRLVRVKCFQESTSFKPTPLEPEPVMSIQPQVFAGTWPKPSMVNFPYFPVSLMASPGQLSCSTLPSPNFVEHYDVIRSLGAGKYGQAEPSKRVGQKNEKTDDWLTSHPFFLNSFEEHHVNHETMKDLLLVLVVEKKRPQHGLDVSFQPLR